MLPAGSSTGSRHRPRDSFQSSVRKSLKLLRKSDSNDSYGFLRSEGLPISVEPPLTRASSSGNRQSRDASRTFIQRTMALFRRQQPRQAPKRQLSPLLPRVYLSRPDTLRRTGRDGPSSLTRLVLPSTDDVSFSSSSFFRRVEEVSALNANRSSAPLAPSLPSTTPPLRPPPRPPRRRPPPPVDEGSFLTTTPPSTRAPTKAQQNIPRKTVKIDLDSGLELQASAATPNNLDPRDSPPLAQQRLYASPSIKSRRASLPTWPASASQPAAPELAPGRDPLSELLAVSDELKAMRNFDSDDILYLTDVPLPLPSLPPTLHAFLDAPSTSLHILEMEIHRESETFLGVPIPCIVVTSESDPLPPMDALATPTAVPLPRRPEVDMLAPPPSTYRWRTDADQSPALVDSDQELGSPPASASPYEDAEDGEDVRRGSPSWDHLECGTSANLNWSWEAVSLAGSPSASDLCTKPVRPSTPKPEPLLRRHQRSLLRRVLGGGGSRSDDTSPTEKDKSWCVPSYKPKRKRISKELIGPPRPLSPTI
ncbi:hypothetical protein EDB92DRAFT_1944783 [Lactarius akahatsu]|uniref:Uncharacterized protein n=1 Tax=Lactarius akahatsu TaxID=416441 RepID=A0AAD4QED8_9AGAM|nr:hypothetical protein EDB92DRAFT_1944783 [Lactarius akahatsu]